MKRRLVFINLSLLAVFLALTSTAALASSTWYVNGVSGGDSNACTSPTTACKTIGHAISLAHSGDSIMVAAATYYENLTIGFSLRIIGSGARTTIIDGRRLARVVTIPHASASVTLSKVTLRNGRVVALNALGGGIYNAGALTINSCTIANSIATTGGGIENSGNLTINNSTVIANRSGPKGSGGGISNAGSMAINNSTITGNSAWFAGGGVYSAGITGTTTTINKSTLSANTAFYGGGINSAGTVFIINSTVSGNTASENGGGIANNGNLAIFDGTLSGNNAVQGGAILNDGGTTTVQNSIIANSPSGGNCSGVITSHAYNLSSDGTCNFNNTGDLNNTDPKLGQLGYYGGPTQTMPLLSGSPAIDAGNPSGCTDGKGHLLKTDQRGKPRPDKEDSGGCDMGAFERQSD